MVDDNENASEEIKEINRSYRKYLRPKMGCLTPSDNENIRLWHGYYGFGHDMIEYAMEMASAKYDELRPCLIESILNTWFKRGHKTLGDVKAAEEMFQSHKKTPKLNFYNSCTQGKYTDEELDDLERKLLAR